MTAPIPSRFANGRPQTEAAIAYARRMHAGQRRGDGTPFILHPLEVAAELHDVGAPDHLIAAGVMHDLLEKTEVSAPELRERFAPSITALVLAVTEDPRIDGWAERKAALRRQVAGAGREALMLFAADKLSKARELRRAAATDSEPGAVSALVRQARARKLGHYRRSLAMLQQLIPGSRLVRALRGELDAMLAEQPTLAATG